MLQRLQRLQRHRHHESRSIDMHRNGFKFLVCLLLFASAIGASGQSLLSPDLFHTLEFAHRGGYYGQAENTIEIVVDHLRNEDLNAMEVDLMLTKDGKLILFHDDTINRMLQYESTTSVYDLTADEICALPFRKRGFEHLRVSRFEDFVDTLTHLAVNEKLKFLIELDFKTTDENRQQAVDELIRIVKSTEGKYDKAIYNYFFVSSFYPGALGMLRAQSDDMVLAFATHPFYEHGKVKSRLAGWLMTTLAKKHHAQIVETHQCYINKSKVKRWKRKGFLVHSFTANSLDERNRIKDLNIASTSDCPKVDNCPHDPSDSYVAKRWCKKCITGELQPEKN